MRHDFSNFCVPWNKDLYIYLIKYATWKYFLSDLGIEQFELNIIKYIFW